MKTSTVLSRSILLVGLLAVSWVTAAPFQADVESDISEDREDRMVEYFKDHPDAALDLLPNLLDKATNIEVTVDEDVLTDLIEKNEDQEANRARRKRQVRFNFGGAKMGSDFNFAGAGTKNDKSTLDRSQHNSNNWSDSSHKDWSKHDSSQKDWSTHDSSKKDWSTHDSSHKDWSATSIDASHKDHSQSHHTTNKQYNGALIGWGK